MNNLEKTTKLYELKKNIEFKKLVIKSIENCKYLEIHNNNNSLVIDKSNSNNFLFEIQKSGTEFLKEEIKQLEKEIEFIWFQTRNEWIR